MEEATTAVCSNCSSNLETEAVYCNHCGFPEGASDEEKAKFHYRKSLQKEGIAEAEKKIKNVKILILVLAGINFLVGLYYFSDEFTFAEGIGGVITAFVFVGCAIWINKQPLTGTLAAFFFWILLQLLAAIIDPITIFSGIILKVIFISLFIKGIKSAREAQELQKQVNIGKL